MGDKSEPDRHRGMAGRGDRYARGYTVREGEENEGTECVRGYIDS